MPAMNDDAMVLTNRVDRIAGKPPPTVSCLLRDSATSKTWWGLPPDYERLPQHTQQSVAARKIAARRSIPA
ncbi:hypothetical protein CFBP1590__1659 [Pseudomonas viridiflava]|uniref:Uncharacterized protein n=1 Tax=Pseudomonas viridiflava TaxID=33069 RepID=A0A1Y6JGZ8_PSEVI|nr:hypothetical protein CFBP1590__1659 [Pseudomonas viridiflava]VVO05885.1 hypothetical protein PS689_03041 [Pseudomonas fluorescens]